MSSLLRTAFHPVAEVDRQDSSVHYTDILFGFVVRELFIRLQDWPRLAPTARLQCLAVTVLVLGSWLGYRRSLHRSTYAVKFFNLPMLRFVIDQLMVVLYFRLAVLVDSPSTGNQDLSGLPSQTARLFFFVFLLYLAWDLLGAWIVAATETLENGTRRPRYPAIDHETNLPTGARAPIDFASIGITVATLAAILLVRAGGDSAWVLPALIAVGLGYRFVKEIRTSIIELGWA